MPTRAFLINTGSDPRLTPELVEASRTVNSLVGDADWSRFVDVPHGKDIVVERSDEGYVIPATKHSATYDFDGVDAVLAKLYDQQEQTCTHILVTHGTDTYNRHLGSYLKEGLTDAHFDMIAFDTVSRARVGSPVIVLGDRVRIANIGEWKQFETSFSVGNGKFLLSPLALRAARNKSFADILNVPSRTGERHLQVRLSQGEPFPVPRLWSVQRSQRRVHDRRRFKTRERILHSSCSHVHEAVIPCAERGQEWHDRGEPVKNK